MKVAFGKASGFTAKRCKKNTFTSQRSIFTRSRPQTHANFAILAAAAGGLALMSVSPLPLARAEEASLPLLPKDALPGEKVKPQGKKEKLRVKKKKKKKKKEGS